MRQSLIARPTCQRLIPLSPLTQSRQFTTSLSLARTDLTAVNSSSANQPRSRYHHQHQYHHSRWHATQASQITPSFSLLLRSMFSFPTALLSSPKANYNLIDGPKSPCQTGTTSSWLQIDVYRLTLRRFKCRQCDQFKIPASFSNKEIKDYQFKKTCIPGIGRVLENNFTSCSAKARVVSKSHWIASANRRGQGV
jgi:hypothetical protein